ncbi:hypothetical protein [Nocardioides piscis]|uniref:hypothetical protein n=1 Tax=Nocardioides piscis TaxID=2714938 RepID=UPI001FE7557B|nr:hypothetical protein [Nocardioides piscis]
MQLTDLADLVRIAADESADRLALVESGGGAAPGPSSRTRSPCSPAGSAGSASSPVTGS